MRVPIDTIFETAADLSHWPQILPHYRWIRYVEQSPHRNVVVMAARRGWIPIHWTSEQIIDRKTREVRFHHLRAFTKGMDVVWTFSSGEEGVLVRIRHDLRSSLPVIGSLVEYIVGRIFISPIARQTLLHMKHHLESHGTK